MHVEWLLRNNGICVKKGLYYHCFGTPSLEGINS